MRAEEAELNVQIDAKRPPVRCAQMRRESLKRRIDALMPQQDVREKELATRKHARTKARRHARRQRLRVGEAPRARQRDDAVHVPQTAAQHHLVGASARREKHTHRMYAVYNRMRHARRGASQEQHAPRPGTWL